MRAGILHLAFAGLGAQMAYSGAFSDNEPSLATSRSIGYVENGRELYLRRGRPAEMVNLRLDRASWEARTRPACTIEGLGACLEMFGLSPGTVGDDTE